MINGLDCKEEAGRMGSPHALSGHGILESTCIGATQFQQGCRMETLHFWWWMGFQ